MRVYMVERSLPGIEMETNSLPRKRPQSKRATSSVLKAKMFATFVRPLCLEAHCMCLFESSNPEFVKEVNEVAHIPFTRIVEALDLTPL